VPKVLLEKVAGELEQLGFLVATSGSESGWLPARDLSAMLINSVIGALRGESMLQSAASALLCAEEAVRRSWDGSQASLENVTVHDLVINAGIKGVDEN
jgi:DNA-binding IscR family transcriptional regulator